MSYDDEKTRRERSGTTSQGARAASGTAVAVLCRLFFTEDVAIEICRQNGAYLRVADEESSIIETVFWPCRHLKLPPFEV